MPASSGPFESDQPTKKKKASAKPRAKQRSTASTKRVGTARPDESTRIEAPAPQLTIGAAIERAGSPVAAEILKASIGFADNRLTEHVIGLNSLLWAILWVGLEQGPGKPSTPSWMLEWLQTRASLESIRGWLQRRRRNPEDVPRISSNVVEAVEQAQNHARSTVQRERFDARHLVAASLTPSKSTVADAVTLVWEQGIGVNVLEFRPYLLERISKAPEPGENLKVWREILGEASEPRIDDRRFIPDFDSDRADGKTDALNIGGDVEAFAQLICLENVKLPLSIALFGSWGSGKTSFMERLLERVDSITAREKMREIAAGAGPSFVKDVVQIKFNAWHYADANLWASITAEFFDQLRAGGAGKKNNATYDALVNRVARHVRDLESETALKVSESTDIDFKLEKAKAEAAASRKKLDSVTNDAVTREGQRVIEEVFEKHKDDLAEIGRRVGLNDLAGNIKTFAEAAHQAAGLPGKAKYIWKYVRNGRWTATVAVAAFVLFLAAVLAWPLRDLGAMSAWLSQAQPWLAGSSVLALAGVVGRAWQVFRPIFSGAAAAFGKRLADETLSRKADVIAKDGEVVKLEQKAKEAKRQAESKKAQLAVYTGSEVIRAPETLLRYLLEDASETKTYEEGLGVVSRARRSFEKLDEIIRRARKERSAKKLAPAVPGQTAVPVGIAVPAGIAVPDRIVLYIDDLDRCTYKIVYDVLQAVHLLLALESFVVVVGVDVRWIEAAISHHLDSSTANAEEMNRTRTGDILREDLNVKPLEYLEKIFQIPFWLQPLSTGEGGTYGQFVEHLLGPRPEENASKDRDEGLGGRGENKAAGQQDTEGTGRDLTADGRGAKGPEKQTDESTDEILSRVVLTTREYDLLRSPEIGALVGKSPRAVKRFLNTYRIIRARQRGSGLDEFLAEKAGIPRYPVAILLLAIDIGQPDEAAGKFWDFIKEDESLTFSEYVPDDASDTYFADTFNLPGLDDAIPVLLDLKAGDLRMYDWYVMRSEVRRYSFIPWTDAKPPSPEARSTAGATAA
jgi:hypothetical protein